MSGFFSPSNINKNESKFTKKEREWLDRDAERRFNDKYKKASDFVDDRQAELNSLLRDEGIPTRGDLTSAQRERKEIIRKFVYDRYDEL